MNFNPRPPRGERHNRIIAETIGVEFQSTPSARRATRNAEDIKALDKFQSTPSARRATHAGRVGNIGQDISIHALREESDARMATGKQRLRYFNPRPPRGERQQKQRKNPMLLFHYTHLCTI